MTGVRAGSQGTGIAAGSQGSGVAGAPAGLPASFVGVGTSRFWNNGAAAQTVTAPALLAGDTQILITYFYGGAGEILAPGGWDLISSVNNDTQLQRTRVYSRVAVGDASDSPVVEPSVNAYGGSSMVVYRDVVVGTPVSVITALATNTTVGPSVTSTDDGRLGLSIATRGNAAGQVWLAPDKGTERLNVSGNWMCLQIVEVSGLSGSEIGEVGHNYAGSAVRTVIGFEI